MKLTNVKIERRDIPVIVLGAFAGFLLVVIALASRDLAAGIFVGLVAGAPCGAGGGALACLCRRSLERK